jgi:hypothetical protein
MQVLGVQNLARYSISNDLPLTYRQAHHVSISYLSVRYTHQLMRIGTIIIHIDYL